MLSNDFLYILTWWVMLLFIGLINLPFAVLFFPRFADRGYIFSKILGIVLLSYLVFILGYFHIMPFTFSTVIIALTSLTLINLFIFTLSNKLSQETIFPRSGCLKLVIAEELIFLAVLLFWSFVRGNQPAIEGLEKFMDYGFVKSILNSTYFPPHDMWLAPAPLNPEFTPKMQQMLEGFYINYYYFGHLITAVLTRLSQIPAAITYNLQIATLAALTFAGSFSIGLNLFLFSTKQGKQGYEGTLLSPGSRHNHKGRSAKGRGQTAASEQFFGAKWMPHADGWPKAILAGLLTAFLVTFSGNLHTIYSITDTTNYQQGENTTPNPPWRLPLDRNLSDYWYPNATRFIPYTIHEFPSYSFIVSDLHGHVSNIPYVLLLLAVLFTVIQKTQKNSDKFSELFRTLIPKIAKLILIGWLLAVFYMTNAWDLLIYGLLTLIILIVINSIFSTNVRISKKLKNFTISIILVGIAFIISSYPFRANFTPISSKIGINCGYETAEIISPSAQDSPIADAGKSNLIEFGPFTAKKGDCQKTPLWMHLILWGFFYYAAAGFFAFVLWPKLRNHKNTRTQKHGKLPVTGYRLPVTNTDKFITLLILLSVLLLWIPEFFYIKDIYPAHFRANTMFKLGYQAFIMLSIVSGYTIIKTISNFKFQISNFNKKQILKTVYILLLIPQLFFIGIYPLFGINSYYNGIKNYKGLYGLNWLRERYPDDYEAIVWLDKQVDNPCPPRTLNIEPQTVGKQNYCPVIVEAVGDSYTQYARVSANTGLPTLIGWPVHEWLWRGGYDEPGKRREEVKTIYTSTNINEVAELLAKYKVQYIFAGSLEREAYPNLNEKIFGELGKVVYTSGETKIYKLTQ